MAPSTVRVFANVPSLGTENTETSRAPSSKNRKKIFASRYLGVIVRSVWYNPSAGSFARDSSAKHTHQNLNLKFLLLIVRLFSGYASESLLAFDHSRVHLGFHKSLAMTSSLWWQILWHLKCIPSGLGQAS